MTYEQLLLSALSKADEEPGDEIIDKVVEDAVNYGYKIIATEVDPQIKTMNIEYINGLKLPSDFYAVYRLEKEGLALSQKDYYIESQRRLFITNKDYSRAKEKYDLSYIYVPEPLVNKTDEPITRMDYDYLIIMYGAYNVLLYKKRYSMAEMLFAEFMRLIGGGE